ncbi:hypothetical protein J7E73_20900 [Paenibacillus albidus]|uniref:hypothetical protein n=1 Tax=Paenibacillus albidus TaxID=2041023 RepID=UPI001BE55DFE|nr:hypothetical protein [Paenibacillus albidus]MBT2291537.1 hypothetical protein [Paenibacillus albidus]
MANDETAQKVIQKAFNSYIKLCLQRASRDYFRKANRYANQTVPYDETLLRSSSLNLSLTDSTQVENCNFISQIIEELGLRELGCV